MTLSLLSSVGPQSPACSNGPLCSRRADTHNVMTVKMSVLMPAKPLRLTDYSAQNVKLQSRITLCVSWERRHASPLKAVVSMWSENSLIMSLKVGRAQQVAQRSCSLCCSVKLSLHRLFQSPQYLWEKEWCKSCHTIRLSLSESNIGSLISRIFNVLTIRSKPAWRRGGADYHRINTLG